MGYVHVKLCSLGFEHGGGRARMEAVDLAGWQYAAVRCHLPFVRFNFFFLHSISLCHVCWGAVVTRHLQARQPPSKAAAFRRACTPPRSFHSPLHASVLRVRRCPEGATGSGDPGDPRPHQASPAVQPEDCEDQDQAVVSVLLLWDWVVVVGGRGVSGDDHLQSEHLFTSFLFLAA